MRSPDGTFDFEVAEEFAKAITRIFSKHSDRSKDSTIQGLMHAAFYVALDNGMSPDDAKTFGPGLVAMYRHDKWAAEEARYKQHERAQLAKLKASGIKTVPQ